MAGGYPPPPASNQPPQGYPPQGQPGYPPPGAQGYPPQGQPGYPPPANAPIPGAPYGIDPKTGIPFSDKQKMMAGMMQLACIIIVIPGIGRFYTGHTGLAIAQLVLGCTGIGQIWSIIDGIMMLTGAPTDAQGRPLRD